MARQRQSQHRVERETTRARELSETRKENQQLKRQVARLQKTVAKLEVSREPEPDHVEEPRSTVEKPQACVCGVSNWTSFTTPGGKLIRVCKACKARAL